MILHLRKGEAGYYKLVKQNFVGSRETFSLLVKTLEKEGIVERKLIDSRPPRVQYNLTRKGKEVAEILLKLDRVLKGQP